MGATAVQLLPLQDFDNNEDEGAGEYAWGYMPCHFFSPDGCGCGNEVRSEAPMVRKFILDCLRYWATEFGMDGFRFDLMGLMDVPTLTAASAALKAIDEQMVMYGEPWTGGITPVVPTYKGAQRGRGFGVFNDTLRDALRGSPFHAGGCFVLDAVAGDAVKRGIMGSIDDFADSPTEVINYVECHDNRTLYDQLWEIYRGGGKDDDADA
eukprot:contig_10948_g2606